MSKNTIEKYITTKIKEVQGKGPKNLIVNIDGNVVNITIVGFLSKLDVYTIEKFPEFKDAIILPRDQLFHSYLEANKDEINEVLGVEVIGAKTQYNLKEDMAHITLKVR